MVTRSLDGWIPFFFISASPAPESQKGDVPARHKGTMVKGHGKKRIGYSGIPQGKIADYQKKRDLHFHLTQ
jgi:hypothetical protein